MQKDSIKTGIFLGLIGPVFGFLIFGLIYAQFKGQPFQQFLLDFWNLPAMQSPVLAVSLWMNGLLFYLVNRWDFVATARGILISTFIFAPIIVYLKFFG